MPTYDYECTSCGHTFEIFHGMTEEPELSCPQCGNAVRRLIGGGAGIIFKGNGFYATDNRKSSTAADSGKKDDKEGGSGGTDKASGSESGGSDSSSSSSGKDSGSKSGKASA
ncbi:MAG: zinc ribbon domain-containing protein [Spirochaetales bacterium]|nr:zinc ribbon domain-containing protein [Spirochaetales bacterium]MCF7937176.1 zinc ribbon domain-containing protein [Spirochaetales bacterium]